MGSVPRLCLRGRVKLDQIYKEGLRWKKIQWEGLLIFNLGPCDQKLNLCTGVSKTLYGSIQGAIYQAACKNISPTCAGVSLRPVDLDLT